MRRDGGLFAPPGVVGRLAPFALGAAASGLTLLIPGQQSEPRLWVVGLALVALSVGSAALMSWSRLPSALEITPVLVFLVAVMVLRQSEGGATSGFGPLLVLPIVFVALHGTRGQTIATVGASTLVFALPAMFLDEVDYPSTEWRRTIIWLIAGITTTQAIQSLVREIARRSDGLEALARASRALLQSDDPRAEVCEAACRAAGGDFAVLMAPRDGALVPVAASGTPLPDDIRIPLHHPTSGTARALASGTTVFATEAATQMVSERFTTTTGVASAIFEPVLVAAEAVAVLVVGYRSPVARVPEDVQRSLTILAADAAQAIEREGLVASLRAAATHAPLTGVANRRLLEEFLEREAAGEMRTRLPLSVAMIDLDRFKEFNDRHGHVAGDELLATAAAAWADQLRPTDLLARYGGEEFAVVLVGAGPDEALTAAERLRLATPAPTTCSIGVATWDGVEATTQLIARADGALYLAKDGGRDQVIGAAPGGSPGPPEQP